ncbi:hypothetical protein CYCD_09920 [Tenuifilaceae bacterium CYCD]|nr:hypothetical protein CYCD_09920 [Tenuifilaceae bacterium CYCD]
MKNLLLTGLFLMGYIGMMAQDQESLLRNLETKDTLKKDSQIVLKVEDTITVTTRDTIAKIKTDTIKSEKSDTSIIRIGKKRIVVVDSNNKTTIEFPEKDEYNYEFKEKERFEGHWAGLEFGINGFMDKNQSINLKGDLEPLDLKQARSWNFNINFMQYSLGFGTDKAGLVTGMGLEFNNYHFSNPISLKVENGITSIDSSYIIAGYDVQKTKLSTTNLTVPLLLEFQIPTGDENHRIYLSAGVIGGLRLGSHTKVVYDDGDKKKDKNHGDFNIATFRYGLTARVGYRGLRLFANYYPVQLFEKGKTNGLEVYPFSVGLVLIPFND